MDYPPCFNVYNNINYRKRSQTLQPVRRSALTELSYSKQFMLTKYLESQQIDPSDPDRANYANVPLDREESLQMIHHHPKPHNHHGIHNRSFSQHFYYTMCPVNDRGNNYNNYYNLGSNIGTIIPAQSRHPLPVNDPSPPMHNHQTVNKLGSMTILQVCNELGNLDSPPPMPSSRNYSITGSRESGFYKVSFPQRRYMRGQFTDPSSGISVASGTLVSVLGPSKEDRSKFTICFNDQHIDLPHQLTHGPQPMSQWN